MVNMGCFFTIGLGLSTLGPLILNTIFEWTDEWGTMLMTGAIVGGVLGLVLSKISAVTRGPHPDEEDGRSMSDEEFEDFVATCEEEEYDPFLLWWINCDNQPGDKQAPAGIGLEDETGQRRFPVEITTDYIIKKRIA